MCFLWTTKLPHAQIAMAMRMYDLEHLQHFWEPVRDSRVALAWNRTTVVLAFRGTASLKNAETDIKACPDCLRRPSRGGSLLAQRHLPICSACGLASLQERGWAAPIHAHDCKFSLTSASPRMCVCDCKLSLIDATNRCRCCSEITLCWRAAAGGAGLGCTTDSCGAGPPVAWTSGSWLACVSCWTQGGWTATLRRST